MTDDRWSWRIGRVLGITIRVHAIFLVLLLFVGYTSYTTAGWVAAARSMLLFVSIFAFVLLHELGHSAAARFYGVSVLDISLLPIGGLARLANLPEEPKKEIVIALAGPAVNFVAAALLWSIAALHGTSIDWSAFSFRGDHYLASLFWINLLMATFNLVPAFPMDGGRVLRGLLAVRLGYRRATHTAVNVGQTVAVLFGFGGLFYNWWLILVAVFIFVTAGSEERFVRARSSWEGIPVSRVMSKDFTLLRADEPIGNALEHCHEGRRGDFPILNEGRLVGIVTRQKLLAGLHKVALHVPVAEVMDTGAFAVSSTTDVGEVYGRMVAGDLDVVVVVDEDKVVGVVGWEDIGRFVMKGPSPETSQESNA